MAGTGFTGSFGGFFSGGLLQRVGKCAAAVPGILRVGGDELLSVAEDTVLGDVEAVELLLRLNTKADSGLEHREHYVRGYKGEASGSQDAQGLYSELGETAAVEETRVTDPCGLDQRGSSEETRRKRAPDTAHPVGRDGPQGIVDTDLIDIKEDQVHDHAGQEPDDNRSPGLHEGAGCGNGDECRDRPVASHPDVYVAPVNVAHEHGPENDCAGSQVGGEGYVGERSAYGFQRGAGVESPPADPQDYHAQNSERHIVAGNGLRTSRLVVLTNPGPEQ